MKIGEIQLESPLMNAGGLVKTVSDVEMMAATGVGAVVAGSFTLDEKAFSCSFFSNIESWLYFSLV